MMASLVPGRESRRAPVMAQYSETGRRADRSTAPGRHARAISTLQAVTIVLPGLTRSPQRGREGDAAFPTNVSQDLSTHYAKGGWRTRGRDRFDSRVDISPER